MSFCSPIPDCVSNFLPIQPNRHLISLSCTTLIVKKEFYTPAILWYHAIQKVGCDWIIDSDRQEDRCGICGGDGKQCSPLKGIINTTLPLNVTEGYVLLLTIPAHSRHIRIRELSNSPNFLALASVLPPDQRTPSFFLNGDNLISMAGEFVVAGAECRYAREDELESIEIIQAIQQPITLYVWTSFNIRKTKVNAGDNLLLLCAFLLRRWLEAVNTTKEYTMNLHFHRWIRTWAECIPGNGVVIGHRAQWVAAVAVFNIRSLCAWITLRVNRNPFVNMEDNQ